MSGKISSIAALALAAALGSTQPGCVQKMIVKANEADIVSAIEKRDQAVRQKLDDILQSIHCVRHVAEYTEIGGERSETNKAHGTAFAYARRDGYTYLITNAHVVTEPDEMTESTFDMDFDPEFLFEKEEKRYRKSSETLTLVKNDDDADPADDIALEKVLVDEKLDIAIIRTKEDLHVSDSYAAGRDIKPEIGDDIFIIGYPGGVFASSRGIIANLHYDDSDDQDHTGLDIRSAHGGSGSPYFIRRADRLYWMGLFDSFLPYEEDGDVPLHPLGIPINRFADLLDTHQPVVEKDGKKEGE